MNHAAVGHDYRSLIYNPSRRQTSIPGLSYGSVFLRTRRGEWWIGGLGKAQLLTAQPLPRALFFFSDVSTNVRFRLPHSLVPLVSSNVDSTSWLNFSMLIRER